MNRIPLLLSLAAVIGVIVLFYRFSTLKEVSTAPAPHIEDATEEHEKIEVAVFMGRIQHFHQKWWLAGKAGNADLSRFYLHEMEEAMEEIADAHVKDDGVDVSAQMEVYGEPTIEHLTELLDKDGVAAMHGQAEMLASTCNGCHVATRHGYIRIKTPSAVDFPDQDFAPAK